MLTMPSNDKEWRGNQFITLPRKLILRVPVSARTHFILEHVWVVLYPRNHHRDRGRGAHKVLMLCETRQGQSL